MNILLVNLGGDIFSLIIIAFDLRGHNIVYLFLAAG